MDQYFEYFLKKFGPAIDPREVSSDTLARFKGRLPDQLLSYWQAHGFSGYADGLFWTVNPQDYEPVLNAWLGGSSFLDKDALHIIARTAFGHLLIWGEQSGFLLQIFAPGSYVVEYQAATDKEDLEFAVQMFFGFRDRSVYEFDGRFKAALQRLGRLSHDEMYGFVPALALGGPADVNHLERVNAVEHLVLLAQLGGLKTLG